MTADIHNYTKSCVECQRVKPRNHLPFGRLQPLPVAEGKWRSITVDMIVGLPISRFGFNAIIVFVDRFTKMVHLVPCKDTLNAEQFCQLFVANVIRLHGAPTSLISDRGSIFAARFTQCFTASVNCLQQFSTAFHPQTDGQTERANRVVEDVLRSYCDIRQTDWDAFLPMAEFAMNNAPSEATQQTPFILNYGINPRHPSISQLLSDHFTGVEPPRTAHGNIQRVAATVMQHTLRITDASARHVDRVPDVPAASQFTTAMRQVIERTKLLLQVARERMCRIADPHRNPTPPFQVGDQVMLSTKNIKLQAGANKLLPRFVGPFPITEVINPVAFRLRLPATMRIHTVFHTSLLRPYHARNGALPSPSPLVINDEEEYEVQALMGRRDKVISKRTTRHGVHHRTQRQYLVRWKGYGPEHNEWISVDELQRHCAPMIAAMDRQLDGR